MPSGLSRGVVLGIGLLLGIGMVLAAMPTARLSADDALPVAEVQQDGPVDFENEILPLLRRNCIACHNATEAEGDLVLESPQTILQGGFEGPGVVPGNAGESLLFQLAAHRRESFMPPEDNTAGAGDFTPQELGLIKLWIEQGAKGDPTSGPTAIVWQQPSAGVNPIYAVAVTPHGRFVAAGRANQISVYSVPAKRELSRLTDPELLELGLYDQPGVSHRDAVQSLAFSPSGRQLASGGFRTVKIWDRNDSFRHAELPAAEADIRALAVSNDGSLAAIGQADGKVQIYDVASGQVLRTLAGLSAAATGLAWSPDAGRLVGGANDGTVSVWNVEDGQQVARFRSPGGVNAVAVVNAGQQIVTGGGDSIIRLWEIPVANAAPQTDQADRKAPQPIREMPGHNAPITALAPVPNRPPSFVSVSLDGTARHWDANDGTQIRQFDHGAPLCAVAVRPDGNRIATAAEIGTTKLWNAEDGQPIAELTGDSDSSRVVAELQRAVELANRHVRNAKTDIETATKRQQAEAANAEKAAMRLADAQAAAKEKAAAAEKSAADKEAAEKELAEITEQITAAKRSLETAEEAVRRAAAEVSHREDLLEERIRAQQAAADRLAKTEENIARRQARVAESERQKLELDRAALDAEAPPATAEAAPSAADAERRAAASAASAALAELRRPVRAVTFSPGGTQFAVAGDAGRVDFYSSESGDPLHQLDTPGRADAPAADFVAAAYLNNDRLLTAADDRSLSVWASLPVWSLREKIGAADAARPFVNRVTALDFSPEGDLLAIGGGEPSRSGQLHLWNVETGQPVREIPDAHSDTILDIAFSYDGSYLATSGADGVMKVFETESGRHIRSFEGHTHHVLGVSWRADGRLLASSGADNVVKIWDFNTGEGIRSIKGFKKELTAIDFLGVSDNFVIATGDSQVLTRNTGGGGGPTFAGTTDFVYSVRATQDGQVVVAGGQDSVLHVWNQQGKSIATFTPSR